MRDEDLIGGPWYHPSPDFLVDAVMPSPEERRRRVAHEIGQMALRLKPGESLEIKRVAGGLADWIVTTRSEEGT